MKSPIADKKWRNITRQSLLFQFTGKSLYLSADASGKNRELHSKNKYNGNTLHDPWKSDQKFCPCIAQSCGIGKKPENLSDLIRKSEVTYVR